MHPRDRDLISEQIEYYRQRAPEYDETASPPNDPLGPYGLALEEALDSFGPEGRVLEIACGTGIWTRLLARDATELTALDASAEMLERCRRKVGDDVARAPAFDP